MTSMVAYSDTEIGQAKLLAQLSGRPAKVAGDVFIWNGHLIDRATAIVVLLKVNNQVPVGDSVKMRLHSAYNKRFAGYDETLVDIAVDDQPDTAARIWFNTICRFTKTPNKELSADEVKNILIELHRN